MGTFNGNSYTTFSNWKTGTGKDANSLFANPGFAEPNEAANLVNLHLTPGSPAEGAGGSAATGANTLPTDFDGENRNNLTPVDIGADAGNYMLICPIANAGFDGLIFEGASIQLGSLAEPGLSYYWTSSPAGFTSTEANPIVSPEVSTLYLLTVSNASCSVYDLAHINVLFLGPKIVCPGQNLTIEASRSGTTYQWQLDSGSGYVDIHNNTPYSGTNTQTLNINNLPSSFYGHKYRCVINGLSDATTTLKVENSWVGTVDNFWNNPANWSCGQLPDGSTDVVINDGTVILDTNGICRSIRVAPGATFTVNPGFTLTITH